MKIAFVSSGNSIHVVKLANGLVKNGHNVDLYTLPNHTRLIDEFDKKVKIKVLKFGGKLGYYLNIPMLRLMLLNGSYDLINCHYVSGYGTLTRLANVKPIVASIFGSDVYEYPYKSKFNMRKIVKNLDASHVITSTSNVMVNKVREFYKKEKPIYVTYFGVDLNKFKPLPKQCDTQSECNYFTFGIIKKLEDKYGIEILIKGFFEFLKGVKDKSKFRLLIYGRGSQEEKYKNLVKSLGIEKYVFFKGFIRNDLVPQALSQIDVVCLPSNSDSESFGVSAVEAMACAKPLIVSDASGFTEVVEDNLCGFIFPKGDVNALVSKMRQCFEMDTKDLETMGKNGRNRVQSLFNFEENILTYINAISNAITGEKINGTIKNSKKIN